MCRHEAIESLRYRLVRRGLPASYVLHATRELDDHYADALEDALAAGSTREMAELAAADSLGGVEQLESLYVREARALIIARRHPLLLFGLVPLFALALSWLLLVVAHIAIARTAAVVPDTLHRLEVAIFFLIAHAASSLLALIVVRLAARWFAGLTRPLLACVLLSLLGGYIHACAPHLQSVPAALSSTAQVGRYLLPLFIFATFYRNSLFPISAHRVSTRI